MSLVFRVHLDKARSQTTTKPFETICPFWVRNSSHFPLRVQINQPHISNCLVFSTNLCLERSFKRWWGEEYCKQMAKPLLKNVCRDRKKNLLLLWVIFFQRRGMILKITDIFTRGNVSRFLATYTFFIKWTSYIYIYVFVCVCVCVCLINK